MTNTPTGTDRSPNPTDRPTDVPVTRTDWWATDAGQAARRHLEAWGAVAQIRRVTGDPSAIPAPLAAFGGGKRGHGMPDVLTAYAEVEKYFEEFLEPDERRLMEFIYRDGLTERSACQFVFDDGSKSGVMMEADAMSNPPEKHWIRIDRITARALAYEITNFPDAELRAICRRYGVAYAGFLENRHRHIAKCLADDLNLDLTIEEAIACADFALETTRIESEGESA